MDLMVDGADTLSKGVYIWCHGYCCWQAVPLHNCPGYEALLNVFLRFQGDIVGHWMGVTGGSLEMFKIFCDIQSNESVNGFVKES